jgi:hypothetical protein
MRQTRPLPDRQEYIPKRPIGTQGEAPTHQLTASGPQAAQHASLQQLAASSARNQPAQHLTQLLAARQPACMQLKKKTKKQSKHDRKDRRLAKDSGLHPDEVEANPRAIQEEVELRYGTEEDGLATVARELEGKFMWTLPGGMLEYKTLFVNWNDYYSLLREHISKKDRGTFAGLSRRLEELDVEAGDEALPSTVTGILDRIRSLIAGSGENDGAITLGDQFKPWLETGAEPDHLNCWEATLFACEKAGKLSRSIMLAYYNQLQNKSSENVFRKFVLNRSIEGILESDEGEDVIPSPMPIKNAESGNILCFWQGQDIHHVAIYLSDGNCMSIWVEDTINFSVTPVNNLLKKYGKSLHLEIVKL